MSDVAEREWDALENPDNPFLEWRWLNLLETTGSVGRDSGWRPRHLLVRDAERLVLAAPMYVKEHSEGEFVFDHPWVEVAYRLGTPYYPKLVGMSPFTPAGGYRLLMASDADKANLARVALAAMHDLTDDFGLGAVQFNYVHPSLIAAVESSGYCAWEHQSFIWENRGYADFDAFLGRFRSGARKNVRKERRALRDAGVRIVVHEGRALTRNLFSDLYGYYVRTNAKFGLWGCKYLERDFLLRLPRVCPERLAVVAAYGPDQDTDPEAGERPLGMALLGHKNGKVFGRYWGGEEHIPYLHFEVCYYTPIEWAITRGYASFDPGIGGFHKVRRGFVSVPNVSLHRFADARLRAVMQAHMPGINEHLRAELDALNSGLPLKADAD